MRRDSIPGEPLVRCVHCGKVEIPLNDAELWHYVRTGDGLPGPPCPKDKRGWHKWEALTADREMSGAPLDSAG
jgi:hypothetical protein